jgi:prepilin-type processing-associated H-X9-DG protein
MPALALTLGACGGAAEGLSSVTGKIVCDGQPAAGAVLLFHRQAGEPAPPPSAAGVIPSATVRDDGSSDGTSNTLMIAEGAGRPGGYNHSRTIYNRGGPVDGVINPVNGGGGAWADPFSFAHLNGATPDGIRGQGTCLINCTSNNEIFSFHPGGANLLFADGSVHFVRETVDPRIVVYLITRADGEIISSDQY